MSEESRIGDMRERLGYEKAKKGEPIHKEASSEFASGYGFGGSNVMPSKFGKADSLDRWTCIGCQHENSSKRRWMSGGTELCWNCGVDRNFVDEGRIDSGG